MYINELNLFIHFSSPHKTYEYQTIFPFPKSITNTLVSTLMAMSPSILSLCLTYTSSIWPCAIFRIFCNYGIITTEISTSSNNNKNNNSNESTIKSRTEEATSLSHCWNLCCLHL